MVFDKRLAAGIFSLGVVLASPAPQVTLKAGTLYGTTCSGVATSVYHGIPYAQPPIGNLRFLPPHPMNVSFPNGAWNATQASATCIQLPGQFAWTEPSSSENCLTLTVYVPPGASSTSSLPVKVWAHGGGDTGGSDTFPLYDLCHMATDSVAVAIQYRLGPLGFLALDSAGVDGNMGIRDQIAALEWVQANIAAFGGDPKKVLLFGQSSGADDAYAIASLPQAKSLISSVICESGGGLDLAPYETMQSVGADYAASLNCSSSNLSCLQSASVEDLISAYVTLPAFGEGQGTFSNPDLSSWAVGNFPNSTYMATPYLDGKLFTQQPLVVGPQVPIAMGSNLNDGSLFAVPPLFGTGGPVTADNYTEFLTQFGSQASAIAQRYPLSLFNSSGSTTAAVVEALTYLETTFAYTCFTYRGLRSAANSGVPAYAYSFAHTLSCPWLWVDGSPFPTGEEATAIAQPMHTEELPLVFGNLDSLPWGNGTCNLSSVEHALSAQMKASWTAMAATGNPSTQNLAWTPFDECSSRGLYINNTMIIQQLDFSECEFWDQVQHNLGGAEVSWPSDQTCVANGTSASNGTTPATSATPSSSIVASSRADGLRVAFGTLVAGLVAALVFLL